jgi:4-aminobutyrate aminotransferase-like enzyme
MTVLEVIKEKGLQENELLVGNYFKEKLLNLKRKYPQLADFRGKDCF